MKRTCFFPAITFVILVLLFSCKKNEGKNPDNNTEDPEAVADLLHKNTSFESVYDSVLWIAGLVGSENSTNVGFSDFTVDDKNRLNVVFWGSRSLQQGSNYLTFRKSIDLKTGKPAVMDLSNFATIAYNSNFGVRLMSIERGGWSYRATLAAFKPYTNYFITGYQYYDNASMLHFYHMENQAANDVGPPNDFRELLSGEFDMAFRNPTVNIGKARGFFTYGVNHPTDENLNYMARVHSHYVYDISQIDGAGRIMSGLTEPRTSGRSVVFEFLNNKIQVFEVDPGRKGGTGSDKEAQVMLNRTLVTTMMLSTPLGATIKTKRHYSTDGNILSFYIYDETIDKYSTFVYNFTTKNFKRVLDNVSLSYGEKGKSDTDMDDEGYLYYSGYGKNGAEKSATSIYKINGSSHTLVGTDGFLKYGTIEMLKVMNGKVYLGVVATRSGTFFRQVTILRQK